MSADCSPTILMTMLLRQTNLVVGVKTERQHSRGFTKNDFFFILLYYFVLRDILKMISNSFSLPLLSLIYYPNLTSWNYDGCVRKMALWRQVPNFLACPLMQLKYS